MINSQKQSVLLVLFGETQQNMTLLRHFYRIAVNCFLITLALLVSLGLGNAIAGQDRLWDFVSDLPLLRVPIGILGAFSAVGMITLWFGMIMDCLASRKLSMLSKLGWLLLLVITNWLGTLIYYYQVFNKAERPRGGDAAVVSP